MTGITIRNVSKHFGQTTALDDVSLRFGDCKIYGLLGRNGAGKSTLLNILTNRLFADSGEVTVDGESAAENDTAQRKLYLMSEKTYYPEKMRLRELFTWTGRFYPDFDRKCAEQIAEQFSLGLDKQIRGLSTGYLSIAKLTVALSVNTPYLLLDEPVLGLDANHRELFYRLLLERYIAHPSTIVISTHLIEEVSSVIENVVILKQGRIISDETRDELLARGYTVSGSAEAVDAYIRDKEVIGVETLAGLKAAHLLGEPQSPESLGLTLSPLDLQKLFIQLTNS